MIFALAGGRAYATNYVFSTFKGDAVPQEALSIYNSSDALNFKLVSDTGFSGPSGALRDPSIMRYVDGRYYVAYTDPPGTGCCGKEDHFSIAFSTDLLHWTNLTIVNGGVPGLAHVWAPEWFVEGATVAIIANIDTLNTDSDFKPYIFTALNTSLTSWSGPVAMNIGPNYIDTFALKVENIYHVFTKNETTRYVEHATGYKLTGPWTFIGKADWAGWGSGMEGPAVVQLDDGTWRIYLDGQGAVGFLYANSRDLISWSPTSPLPGITNVVRHGTVIRDSPVGGGNTGGTGGGNGRGGATGSGGIAGASGGGGTGGTTNTGGIGMAGSGGIAGASGVGGLGGTMSVGGTAGYDGEKGGSFGASGVLGTGGSLSPGDGGMPGTAGFPGNGGVPGTGGSPERDGSGDTDTSLGNGSVSPHDKGPASQDAGCGCDIGREGSSGVGWLACLLGGVLLCGRERSARKPARRRPNPPLRAIYAVQCIIWISLIGCPTGAGCAASGQARVNVTADADAPSADGSPGGTTGTGGTTGGHGAGGTGGAETGGQGGGGRGSGGLVDTGAGGAGGDAGVGGTSGKGGAGAQAGMSGLGGGGGGGGANGTGAAGGSNGAVDGWYEAEAVPPNALTNAATLSHSDEGQNLRCLPNLLPGLSSAEAHGVTEGANCASGGGMVVNILGRSPCNPETPSSYTACQNLGAGIEFHDVSVPTDGTYDVTWWYHCGLNDHYGDTKCGGVHYTVGSSCRPHLIDVNGIPMSSAGAKYYQFPCYSTAWSFIHAATTALPLKAGSNVIYIHAPGATTLDAADIDAINVLPQGKGPPPLATPVMSGD
jgi:hypothetical protein